MATVESRIWTGRGGCASVEVLLWRCCRRRWRYEVGGFSIVARELLSGKRRLGDWLVIELSVARQFLTRRRSGGRVVEVSLIRWRSWQHLGAVIEICTIIPIGI